MRRKPLLPFSMTVCVVFNVDQSWFFSDYHLDMCYHVAAHVSSGNASISLVYKLFDFVIFKYAAFAAAFW